MALGISDAVEISGRVVDLVKKGITIDLQEQVMNLREAVLNGRDENLRLRQEIQQLRQELREQENWGARILNYELVTASGGAVVYRSRSEPVHYARPACIEAKRLHILQDRRSGSGDYDCPHCKASFGVDPPEPFEPVLA